MAIKDIIARGIGFSPGSVKFIVTHGFGAPAVVPPDTILNSQSLTGRQPSPSVAGKQGQSALTGRQSSPGATGQQGQTTLTGRQPSTTRTGQL